MFLWSQDQNTKCQFKLTLGTLGFHFAYIYNLGLFYCKVSIIFYVRIIGSPLKIKRNVKENFFFNLQATFHYITIYLI